MLKAIATLITTAITFIVGLLASITAWLISFFFTIGFMGISPEIVTNIPTAKVTLIPINILITAGIVGSAAFTLVLMLTAFLTVKVYRNKK